MITKKLTFCFYFDKYYYVCGSIQQRNPGKLVLLNYDETTYNHSTWMQFYKLKQYNPLLFMIIHLNFENFFQIYWIEMDMICSKSFVNIILFLWIGCNLWNNHKNM